MLEGLERFLYGVADAIDKGSVTRRRALQVSAATAVAAPVVLSKAQSQVVEGLVRMGLAYAEGLAHPETVEAAPIEQSIETVTQQANVVSKAIRYQRGDRAYQTLGEAWGKFIAFHLATTGEDATPFINRFLDPWKFVTDPGSGICNGTANWRALQPRETPEGVSLDGYSFTADNIDTLYSSWFYQAAASMENFSGRIYQPVGFCGTGGERSQPAFINNMLWKHIAGDRVSVAVEIATNPGEVWSYAIYKFSQVITRLSDGTSRFDTTLWGNRLIDNRFETGPEKVIGLRYRINDNDPYYEGGFEGGTRINRLWVPDPRTYAVVNRISYQMENNAITPLMLESMRKLFPFSDSEWAYLTTPDLQPVFCG